MTVEEVDFDVREVLMNSVALLVQRAQSKNISLNHSIDENIGGNWSAILPGSADFA